MDKKSGKGLRHLVQAVNWSLKGIRSALRHEEAFRQEVLLCCILVPVALLLGEDMVSRVLLVGSLLLVLLVELLNSAVEAAVDRIGPEYHELSGRAKDLGSSAVFLSIVNAVFVWGMLLA